MRHVEQPIGIVAAACPKSWPDLGPFLARLARGDTEGARSDCHRLRGEAKPARADYDTAIRLRSYKHRSFLAAVRLALARRDGARARRYADWGVFCQPESPDIHEALGDYCVAVSDSGSASNAFARAIQLNPSDQAVRAKWEKLNAR